MAKYKKIKFIETSAITGDNINEAFLMIAREINSKFEAGILQLSDGWDGIKPSGLMRSQSISLSDYSQDPNAYDKSNCACWSKFDKCTVNLYYAMMTGTLIE